MSEHKQDERNLSGAPPPSFAAMLEPPPTKPAPSPPSQMGRKGMSKRTQPTLSATLTAMKDQSFDASWKRAKDKVIQIMAKKKYPDVSLPTNQKDFLSRNKNLSHGQIDYNKFDKKIGKHRARHNLVVAHQFFPIFYEKLKSQIEPTLSNANDCLAMLGMQGTAVGEAAREAREYQSLAAKYGEEATDSRKKVKAAEFDARMASESAGEEVRKTMKERRAREREAQILVEMQAHAAKAINEENAELKRRNTLLEKENIKLKSEMQMIQDQSFQLASQNAELMKENSEIRKRASSKRSKDVGMLSLNFGNVDDSSAAAISQASTSSPPAKGVKKDKKKTRGWSLGSFRKKSGEGSNVGGRKRTRRKRIKRKRTRKKCNNRRLKKKMLCVRGTKKRLKKLKKYTKRLKLKLTRCSKKRLAKNFSVRKKRKYTRRK